MSSKTLGKACIVLNENHYVPFELMKASSLSAPADLPVALAALRESLRPGQREMADWQGGPLAGKPGVTQST